MLIAQISDLHVRACGTPLQGHFDTEEALCRCVSHLLGLRPAPDLVLATGDLADNGCPEDYALLRRELDRLPMPVYAIPGNHDDRAAMRAAFADRGYLPANREFLCYSVEDWPLRLIGLDTVLPGEVGGGLCDERLGWLAARLDEQPTRPTLIFMHHPPFATGIGFLDTPFPGSDRLKVLIERNRQVRQIICGHQHRAVHCHWAGTTAAIAPSAIYQMSLAIGAGDDFSLIDQPPAISLYLWTGGDDGPIGYTSLIGFQENAASRVADRSPFARASLPLA
jgi:3',5'-cyclic AMP phosphodiesterase CpdA